MLGKLVMMGAPLRVGFVMIVVMVIVRVRVMGTRTGRGSVLFMAEVMVLMRDDLADVQERKNDRQRQYPDRCALMPQTHHDA